MICCLNNKRTNFTYTHVGSLLNLAKYPASTVQILGAEKALFRLAFMDNDQSRRSLNSIINLYNAILINILINLMLRALKTKHDTPKYGLIYHASLVGQSNPKNKGKVYLEALQLLLSANMILW